MAAGRVRIRSGCQEGLSIGVVGDLSEDIFVYYFHDLSEVHDGDAGAQIMYDLKVVGNKEIGKIECVLEIE